MCHSPLDDARIWIVLLGMDKDAAEQVRYAGCAHCGGVLHVANYPRKPRGVCRALLGVEYEQRLSFCCSLCRCRATPVPTKNPVHVDFLDFSDRWQVALPV